MMRFAFGGKCGSPVTIASSSLPLLNRSGINKEPSAALPIPKLNLDKKRRRFMLRPCSKISFCIDVIFIKPAVLLLSAFVASHSSSFASPIIRPHPLILLHLEKDGAELLTQTIYLPHQLYIFVHHSPFTIHDSF